MISKHKEKKEPKDKVNIIGFFQDKYHTDDEFKTLRQRISRLSDYPFQIKEQMKDLKTVGKVLMGTFTFQKSGIQTLTLDQITVCTS